MKLKYLGTAAAEGFPAVYCNCQYCEEARRLGGKNIRTRSQAMINETLLLDLPADTYYHFLQQGIRGDRIQYLFVTHSHSDHFYPGELKIRMAPYAHKMEVPILQVWLNPGAYQKWEPIAKMCGGMEVHEIRPFETVTLPEYEVTALPARHYAGDDALFYLVRSEGRTLCYAHDTGYFYEGVFEYLKEQKIRFDLISLDCTNIDIPIDDTGSHMGLDNIGRLLERLTRDGVVDENTKKIINHFSHNGNPLHHVLEKRVEGLGYEVSYDGMEAEW